MFNNKNNREVANRDANRLATPQEAADKKAAFDAKEPVKVALVPDVVTPVKADTAEARAAQERADAIEKARQDGPTVRNRPVIVMGPQGTAQEQKYMVKYMGSDDTEIVNKSEIQDFEKYAEQQGQATEQVLANKQANK